VMSRFFAFLAISSANITSSSRSAASWAFHSGCALLVSQALPAALLVLLVACAFTAALVVMPSLSDGVDFLSMTTGRTRIEGQAQVSLRLFVVSS